MKENRKEVAITDIKSNYRRVENSIIDQLYMNQRLHGTTAGTAREDVWKEVFEMIVPKKFVVEHSVFIIDSKKRVSKEVDLAIIDQMYTPYIFEYNKIKYIPIEAVAAVIECKSTNMDSVELGDWCNSIDQLETNKYSIARTASNINVEAMKTQSSTRPIKILCCMNNKKIENSNCTFDFIIRVKSKKIIIEIMNSQLNLYEWYISLNHKGNKGSFGIEEARMNELKGKTLDKYQVKDGDGIIALLTFNFQFNQLLMLINNPILFPHLAYVEMFNGA